MESPVDAISLGNIDYFKEQNNVKLAIDKVYQNEYVVKSSVSSWYDGYIKWVNKTYGNTPDVDASECFICQLYVIQIILTS